jgi:hypothetical protein
MKQIDLSSTDLALDSLSANAAFATIPQLADYLVNGFWTGFVGFPAHHWANHTITYSLGNLNVQEASNALAALTPLVIGCERYVCRNKYVS